MIEQDPQQEPNQPEPQRTLGQRLSDLLRGRTHITGRRAAILTVATSFLSGAVPTVAFTNKVSQLDTANNNTQEALIAVERERKRVSESYYTNKYEDAGEALGFLTLAFKDTPLEAYFTKALLNLFGEATKGQEEGDYAFLLKNGPFSGINAGQDRIPYLRSQDAANTYNQLLATQFFDPSIQTIIYNDLPLPKFPDLTDEQTYQLIICTVYAITKGCQPYLTTDIPNKPSYVTPEYLRGSKLSENGLFNPLDASFQNWLGAVLGDLEYTEIERLKKHFFERSKSLAIQIKNRAS